MTVFEDAAGRVWDRQLSYRAIGQIEADREQRNERRRFLSDHPGHPLGPGMPLGASLRQYVFHQASQMWRGESHLMAWERMMREDPCAFCGAPASGTVDHLEPRRFPIRGLGGAHSWINVAGACESCNGSKGSKPLWRFLWLRAPVRPPRGVASRRRSTKERSFV